MSKLYYPTDPVFRIPKQAIDEEALVHRSLKKFESFEADRTEWLSRREEFYLGWDDYLTPIRKGPWEGSSNVHLPITEIQCNLMHARLMQAFFFLDPWFFVDPQEELDMDRIKKIELEMKYIVMRYANWNKGIYAAIDDWAWDLVTDGMAILSRDWVVENRRYLSVEENAAFKQNYLDLQSKAENAEQGEFDKIASEMKKFKYLEKIRIKPVFNGPIIIPEDSNYILFKGDVVDCTDLNLHETVMKICYFTRDQLLSFKESEFMDEGVIDELLDTHPTPKGQGMASHRITRVEYAKDRMTGVKTVGGTYHRDEYEFLCVWDRVSINPKKSGSADELVYFISTGTQKLARWTYLDRITANGKRPLHMAHLYRRPRRSIGRGMVETQYPLNDLSDLLVNQSIDAGLLANQPMFGFRGNSTFDPDVVRIQPGIGFRMDDPNNDLRFFTFNVNPNWSAPIMGMVSSLSQQLTSLGPMAAGQVGSTVGPLRSDAGVKSLLGESGTNLDVVLKRAKMCYSDLMEGLYMDCVQRMPQKVRRSILGAEGEPVQGPDGQPLFTDITKEELTARVQFGIYANSQNMNKSAMEANAMKMAQFLLQPIAIQSGVVSPANMYEIYMHVIKTMGVQKAYRFLTTPKNEVTIPLNAEIFMIMQGIKPPVSLNDPEHQKKIDAMTDLLNSDQAQNEAKFGYVNPSAMQLLEAVIAEHEKNLQAISQPTNIQNPTGDNVSPTLGQNTESPALAGAPPQAGQGGSTPPQQPPSQQGGQ